MNRTLTNVFLRTRNALSSRTVRPICWSCSITQHYPQQLEYHVLRPLPHPRPFNVPTSIRSASTKLAKPPAKKQTPKKPAAKKPKVKVRKSTVKKQRIKKKAGKKKENQKLKRKALAANKPPETIDSVQALSLLHDKKPTPKPTQSQIRREIRQSKDSLERQRIKNLEGKRKKAREDGKEVKELPKMPVSRRRLPSAERAGIRKTLDRTYTLRYTNNGSEKEKETLYWATKNQEPE